MTVTPPVDKGYVTHSGMTGRWMGASYVLGRDVLRGEPYPHICHFPIPGSRRRLKPWDCAACVTELAARRAPPADPLPPVDDEVRAAEARRLGERE